MDIRSLQTFAVVAEELHFGRAAARLHAAQSTVSAAIQSLERELGVELLQRTTRSVALTATGVAVLVDARLAIEAVDRMREFADEATSGLRGRVTLGTFVALRLIDLPALLATFSRQHPNVEVRVISSPSGSSGLADDLRSGRIDLALLALAEPALHGLSTRRLADLPFALLVPASHRLASADSVAVEDLADEAFVDTPAGFGNRLVVDRVFSEHGMTRSVRIEVAELAAVPGYVAAGLGVAVLPPGLVEALDGVVTVPLSTSGLRWPLFVATRQQPSTAVQRLVELIPPMQDRAVRRR